MRVLVTGGRDFGNTPEMFEKLDNININSGISLLIEGGASGADTIASDWARSRCVPCVTHPANWTLHGKAAGPIRNKEMLSWKPDLVLAFPGGRGTANMVKTAKEAGIEVVEVECDHQG